jgi:DNA-binding MarR family transcriptional regulator
MVHACHALLQCVDAVWRRDRDISLRSLVVFLCVCDNEGIRIKELAYTCRTNEASVSRSVQSLCSPSNRRCSVRHHGLLRVFQSPDDRRNRLVFLTDDGKQLQHEIDTIFAAPGLSDTTV